MLALVLASLVKTRLNQASRYPGQQIIQIICGLYLLLVYSSPKVARLELRAGSTGISTKRNVCGLWSVVGRGFITLVPLLPTV